MFKHQSISWMAAAAAVMLASPLAAQSRSTVSSTDLESAVVTSAGGDRAEVRDWLLSDRAAATARGMGVDVEALRDRVAALDPAALHGLAERVRADEAQLAGGDEKIIIGTTTVIIALLVLILLTS